MKINKREYYSSSSGSVAVEIAIALPVLLGVLFGVFNLSLFLWSKAYMENVVRDAARSAAISISQTSGTLSALESEHEGDLGSMPFLRSIDVQIDAATDLGTDAVADEIVVVRGSALIELFVFSNFGLGPIQITSEVRKRWEYS